MEEKKYRRYDRQFKEEAVLLVTEGGRSVSDVAQSLGIRENLLRDWRQKYKGNLSENVQSKEGLTSSEAEIKKLKRENANLREDKEILKKALAIFSKHPK